MKGQRPTTAGDGQAGFTLAEALAALVMIGLAMGGLAQAAHVLGSMQARAATRVAEGRAARAADEGLRRLLAERGPFAAGDPSGLQGAARGFSFACAERRACGARLQGGRLVLESEAGRRAISVPAGSRFLYLGDRTSGAVWPPQVEGAAMLRSIALVAGPKRAPVPVATARLWREQRGRCTFDPIAQACREDVR